MTTIIGIQSILKIIINAFTNQSTPKYLISIEINQICMKNDDLTIIKQTNNQAATCLAAVCLASHLTMAQYQSSPYSQKKMAPVPSSMSSQMGNYGNQQQQQSNGYDSSAAAASPMMMAGGASQYNNQDQMNGAGMAAAQYGAKQSSSNAGYGAAKSGYGKQGYGEQVGTPDTV